MDKGIYLRDADMNDALILLDWANDKVARENAFNSHTITMQEHLDWLKNVLDDERKHQYILMRNDKPIGQIRLIIDDSTAEIDYSISKDERNYGYGTEIIKLAVELIRKEYPNVEKLIGKVKPSNVASFICFSKNGFEEKFQQMEYNMKSNATNATSSEYGEFGDLGG